MRKLTLTLATGLLAAGLAHVCPPRISAHELFRVAHDAQTAKCCAGPALAREYSAARAVSQPPPSLRGLVIELKNARLR